MEKPPCPQGFWTFDLLEKFLSEKIEAVEKIVTNQDVVNKERFFSQREATQIALDATDRAVTKSELSYTREFANIGEKIKVLDKSMKDFLNAHVYAEQHKNLMDRVTRNDGRIDDIDKKLYALAELKTSKTQGLSNNYLIIATAGILFSVAVSLATVAWNILHTAPYIPPFPTH